MCFSKSHSFSFSLWNLFFQSLSFLFNVCFWLLLFPFYSCSVSLQFFFNWSFWIKISLSMSLFFKRWVWSLFFDLSLSIRLTKCFSFNLYDISDASSSVRGLALILFQSRTCHFPQLIVIPLRSLVFPRSCHCLFFFSIGMPCFPLHLPASTSTLISNLFPISPLLPDIISLSVCLQIHLFHIPFSS